MTGRERMRAVLRKQPKDRLITPRLRRSNFVLHPTADGLPVPRERFQAVQRWVETRGNDAQ